MAEKVMPWTCHICGIQFETQLGGICSRCHKPTCGLHLQPQTPINHKAESLPRPFVCEKCSDNPMQASHFQDLSITPTRQSSILTIDLLTFFVVSLFNLTLVVMAGVLAAAGGVSEFWAYILGFPLLTLLLLIPLGDTSAQYYQWAILFAVIANSFIWAYAVVFLFRRRRNRHKHSQTNKLSKQIPK
jgi:hypothetical protein